MQKGVKMKWIVEAESIDDVVHGRYTICNIPLIECKDCEYYHPYYCEIWSKFGTIQTREHGYCYKADRREE